MYIIKKCDTYGYGKNDWTTIFTSPEAASAVAHFKMEFRYVLEADPNLSRKQIESYLADYYLDGGGYMDREYRGHRVVKAHHSTAFSIYKSQSGEYQDQAVRPDRTELLDKILG